MKSLKIRQNIFGENHPDVAMSLLNLANLYHVIRKTGKAEELYLSSLKIYEGIFGENHYNVAMSSYNLSLFYIDQINMTDLAIIYAKKAFEIVNGLFGEAHPQTVEYYQHYKRVILLILK